MTPEEIRALKAELRACSYRSNQPERALKLIKKLEVDCQTYSRTMDEISKMPLTPADAQRVIAAKDAEIARLREGVRAIHAHALRLADMYSTGSDGRNTFVIFADMIEGALLENTNG